MDLWQTILMGIVEGITEFLPISSTGHLILTSRLLNIPQSDFLSSFQIAIQLGAILAVVLLYARSLILEWEILKRVMAAFIPTAVIGLTFYKVIKQYLMGSELVVAWALLIGGVILIIFESFYKEKETSLGEISALSYKQAILIGVFQSFAMVPGVSRSAATIIGGLSLGLKRKTIVEFSFLLAVPTMVAATGLDIIKSAAEFSADQIGLLAVGFVAAFLVAVVSIKFLLYFIKNHNFVVFGIYRIVIALLFLILWMR
ncbi:MAG: undecaprenyl-diphosphate phosphatase [Candidatus Omnitrophica bacterium]|nr:undecaprenyl-diphosphate phosphatase [Candidatus Omnitrophota bacterium]